MEENANLLLKEIALHSGSFEVEEVANLQTELRLQKSRLLPLIQQIFQCRLRISILISSVMQVFLLNQM